MKTPLILAIVGTMTACAAWMAPPDPLRTTEVRMLEPDVFQIDARLGGFRHPAQFKPLMLQRAAMLA